MDNTKMPFLPEETMRTQRVEIYLNDLKERLKDLRQQHDEVIQNSVDIIKEIDEVSSSLLLTQSTVESGETVPKIKKLIQEFESAKESNSMKTPITIESKVEIRKILQNFEKLNESQVLKDSLVLFKRAKESFDQIDTFLGRISASHLEGNNNTVFVKTITNELASKHPIRDPIVKNLTVTKVNTTTKADSNSNLPTRVCPITTESLKNKICLFGGSGGTDVNKQNKTNNSRYASCCSSVMSIDIFHSTQELTNLGKSVASTTNSLENGYEGDNDDSEYDLFAIKKKKTKGIPSLL